MAELKPCPFCGGAAELMFKWPVYGAGGCEIRCISCKAKQSDFKYSETIVGEGVISTPVTIESIGECIERTIKSWNRRADNG